MAQFIHRTRDREAVVVAVMREELRPVIEILNNYTVHLLANGISIVNCNSWDEAMEKVKTHPGPFFLHIDKRDGYPDPIELLKIANLIVGI